MSGEVASSQSTRSKEDPLSSTSSSHSLNSSPRSARPLFGVIKVAETF